MTSPSWLIQAAIDFLDLSAEKLAYVFGPAVLTWVTGLVYREEEGAMPEQNNCAGENRRFPPALLVISTIAGCLNLSYHR